MDSDELNELVKQAKTSTEAFGRLYDVFQPEIYGYVAKRVPSVGDAEDVTQQIFERLLKAIDNFDSSLASFRTWLYKIAKNMVADFYRSERGRNCLSLEEAEKLYRYIGEQDHDYLKRYLQILDLIKELPESYEEVLGLRLMDDMSNDEIAELLGQSSRYTATKISRALRQLKKLAVKKGILEEIA